VYGLSELPHPADKKGEPGEDIYYLYRITNTGNGLDEVSVWVEHVSGEEWPTAVIEDSNQNGVWDEGEEKEVKTLTLEQGETKLVFLKVSIPEDPAGLYSENKFLAKSQGADDWGDKDSREDVTLTELTPLLTIRKKVDKESARPGDILTYTLTYRNDGYAPAKGVVIVDVIPEHTILVSASGEDMKIEYYVNGSWQEEFDSGATKVRWTRTRDVPAESGDLTVTFKVKVK
jgi:uncharacterized repeat protein (TIGR01451 family)